MLFYSATVMIDGTDCVRPDEITSIFFKKIRDLHSQFHGMFYMVPITTKRNELTIAASCSLSFLKELRPTAAVMIFFDECKLEVKIKHIQEITPTSFRTLLLEIDPSWSGFYDIINETTNYEFEETIEHYVRLQIYLEQYTGIYCHPIEDMIISLCTPGCYKKEKELTPYLLCGFNYIELVSQLNNIANNEYVGGTLSSQKIILIKWQVGIDHQILEDIYSFARGGSVVFTDIAASLGCYTDRLEVNLKGWNNATANVIRNLMKKYPDVLTIVNIMGFNEDVMKKTQDEVFLEAHPRQIRNNK